MKEMSPIFLVILCILLSSTLTMAALDTARQERIDFGHVMNVNSIETEPAQLVPGQSGMLNIVLENNAKRELHDVRVSIDLPSEIAFVNDISRRKIQYMASGEHVPLSFAIVALPSTSESIYEATLVVTYVNHVGTERSENDTIGLVVKSTPHMFAQVEETTIHTRNNRGTVTVMFINNNIGDVKFLTVTLADTEDVMVVSAPTQYVGDLDSDDFESVEFTITIDSRDKNVDLPLSISYRDTLNIPYEETLHVTLPIRTPRELGVSSQIPVYLTISAVILAGIAYYIYRRYTKKRKRVAKF